MTPEAIVFLQGVAATGAWVVVSSFSASGATAAIRCSRSSRRRSGCSRYRGPCWRCSVRPRTPARMSMGFD